MTDDTQSEITRRRFLRASLAGAATLTAAPLALADDRVGARSAAANKPTTGTLDISSLELHPPLPKRKLGKTGAEVCIISQGATGTEFPNRLDLAWAGGIRYFDTADCYGINKEMTDEGDISNWFAKYPERRKEIFLVTKDHTKAPEQIADMVDNRLKACGVDYIDLFFIHGIGPGLYGKESIEWPKSAEWRKAAEQVKKSGKIRFFGFSSHENERADYLQAAVTGGYIDAIMVAYDPFLAPTEELNRAIDACHKAGIGMIAMKTMRAHDQVSKRLPELDKIGLSTRQGLLQAVWSDERIASLSSATHNAEQTKENCEAARRYKGPLQTEHMEVLREVVLASSRTFCPNCDGRCARACGKDLALFDITRFLHYYEKDGNLEARSWYQALETERRNAAGADLQAARRACLCHLDFERILNNAERYLA